MMKTLPTGGLVVYEAASAPTTADDRPTIGARRGYWWRDTSTDDLYVCRDPAPGAADWVRVLLAGDIGATVQAWDADLDWLAANITTAGKALLDAADAAAQRSTLGLGTAATTAASDYATAAQGALADSAVQPGDLAAVATSGAYGDLTGTPSLGTAAGEDTGAGPLDLVQHWRLGGGASVDPEALVGLHEVAHGASAALAPGPLRQCLRATASITLTLPPAADCPPGWHRHLKARGGILTMAASGSDTVDGGASVAIADGGRGLVVRTSPTSFEVY